MQIKVEISEELVALAKNRGVPVETYIQSLLQPGGMEKGRPTRTTVQIEDFFREMAKGSEQLPKLPTESFTRSSFYGDR